MKACRSLILLHSSSCTWGLLSTGGFRPPRVFVFGWFMSGMGDLSEVGGICTPGVFVRVVFVSGGGGCPPGVFVRGYLSARVFCSGVFVVRGLFARFCFVLLGNSFLCTSLHIRSAQCVRCGRNEGECALYIVFTF